MSLNYIIYADESDKEGRYYSNFYGGALVRSVDWERIQVELKNVMIAQNLRAEVKWSKVTSQYLERYIALINTFFRFVAEDVIKIRIMFTQNRFVPKGLTREQKEHEYFLLYYQFIKHAFGLEYSNDTGECIPVKLFLDKLPDTKEKIVQFKSFLAGLGKSPKLRRGKVIFPLEDIAEVKSHNHVILQCLDIVLGSIQFRLNDKHKDIPSGETRRGKKTIAKEKLYRIINRQIQDIYPNFNIGISTGDQGDNENRWKHPYRHWLFVPAEYEVDNSLTKT